MRFFLLAFLFACASDGSDSSPSDSSSASVCPPATEACMNEENHQDCLDVEATCTGEILTMESCPLQFGCDE